MPTFPALDEEPPPRSLLRRAAVPTLVVLGAGAVVVGGVALAGNDSGDYAPGSAPSPTSSAAPGDLTLLATAEQDTLVLTSPTDGSALERLPDDLGIGSGVGTLAPNGRLLLTGDGDLFQVRAGRPRLIEFTAPAGLQGQVFPTFRPWADRGRSVVFIGAGGGSREAVILHELGSESDVRLGTGTDAAGVPTQRAAVVLTTASRQPRDVGSGGTLWPTDKVEWRTEQQRRTLLTPAEFATALELPTTQEYGLSASVSPDGRRIAVYGDDLRSSDARRGGVVVISSSGRVLAAQRRQGVTDVEWSPDGAVLALAATPVGANGRAELDLMRQTGDGGVELRRAQVESDEPFGRPLWSADGRQLIAAAQDGWFVVNADDGTAQSVESPLVPVTWLPRQAAA